MAVGSGADSWIVRPRPSQSARVRLFCFPFAGGGASGFRAWQGLLPDTIEVCAVQLPGRETRIREPALTRMDGLVSSLTEALAPSLSPPYALFGHSLGALVAFELARSLRRHGLPMPVQLLLSGHGAPQLPDMRLHIHKLPQADFLRELARYHGTPRPVLESRELMEILSPTLRADFAALETYRFVPEPPLDLPISVFGGTRDPEVRPEQLEAWREQTNAGFRVRLFPGGHFYLHEELIEVLTAVQEDIGEYV